MYIMKLALYNIQMKKNNDYWVKPVCREVYSCNLCFYILDLELNVLDFSSHSTEEKEFK